MNHPRPIVSALAGLVAAAALSTGAPVHAETPRRPNFLFVYTDDQRWDTLGVVQREQGERGRFPWLKTPNLDRLAAEGLRFRNAFVVNSLCSPSRASFLTGRYGHENGIINNHTPFNPESVTHASLLRKAGYRTGYVGKFHMGSQRGPRPGFDFSASFVGQGRYVDCPFDVDGRETPTRGWVDDVSTDYALRFLRETKDRPFLLVVGFKSAHGPFEPPDRCKDAYAGEQARPVPNLDERAPYAPGNKPPAATKRNAVPSTNLSYFRCLAAADENVGRMLNALDELHLSEDTMVVFSSDNGYYLGEHGLGDKRSAYEESLRIPLLVRYPRLGAKGRIIDRIVLNVDLAPTLLDYAGVSVPDTVQGRSWRPLLEGHDDHWRTAFFYAYFYEHGFRAPMVTAVRTDRAKLIEYPGHEDWTEMFDLVADPYETRNLSHDANHAAMRHALAADYARQRDAVGFRIPKFADDPKDDEPKPALNAWVLDYRFDADDGDRVRDASGHGNHGRAHGAPIVDGRDRRKARRFDGQGYIAMDKSPSLDPAVRAWTLEVTLKADKGDGAVFACGGQSNGYALSLEGGKPVFTINVQSRAMRIAGKQSVTGAWVRLSARVAADQTVRLLVDGQPVAEGRLPEPLRTPNDALQIGADLGSPVLAQGGVPRFAGWIESVRIYSGELQ